ncbi:hypothetical protein CCMSSC00406_0010091 [Pleurotus cornucopiae]|uniref:Uncharacterized protein n=1 Tax=Pleurotus cornucopiae TaxID=5321 RepID=A0ACB7IIM2_PLECO|nr:hypothetical protein CCMSSC00406_0010091 [Pleurotus cornucopiae]
MIKHSKTILAAAMLVTATLALADPLPPPVACLKACFPKDHVCGSGQVLVPPTGDGDCFMCCTAPPPEPEFCLAVCLPEGYVCPDGRPLSGGNGCYNCCGPKD